MKLARMQTPQGVVSGQYKDGILTTDSGEYIIGRDGSLTYPCSPSALYCVGRNFAETLDQMDYERPEEPDFFLKPPAALVGPGQPVVYPEWSDELTYAGELVAVIDQRCHSVAPDKVPDIVRGYTVMNDIDALDQQGRTARKAFDTSAPLGPWIETDLNPHDIEMETVINGETRQSARTAQMLFSPHEIISYLSKRFTLRPGDAIAFGSPANPGTVSPGDTIEITYDGVGTLSNDVVAPQN
ncbi:fumarylacetoacetate hydrolase family protein [Haloarcula laminariae]|uniref:fumarylacetoacetate hydrolase family protein n=1 Tax=Haloarcula laminariae TaxID=2961577 RepID=UPI0021C66EEE|nr:fumarylacetoacetate hydrolase family protein [Halomicroarcula laminariae]